MEIIKQEEIVMILVWMKSNKNLLIKMIKIKMIKINQNNKDIKNQNHQKASLIISLNQKKIQIHLNSHIISKKIKIKNNFKNHL